MFVDSDWVIYTRQRWSELLSDVVASRITDLLLRLRTLIEKITPKTSDSRSL